MQQKIFDALCLLCIPANLLGYRYIVTALEICVDNPMAACDITGLYGVVADLHGTTATRAERAIRHAIGVAFNQVPKDVAGAIISPYAYHDRPTNGVFVGTVAEWLRVNS